eukprot:696574-Hanusia_phi.AAC.2
MRPLLGGRKNDHGWDLQEAKVSSGRGGKQTEEVMRRRVGELTGWTGDMGRKCEGKGLGWRKREKAGEGKEMAGEREGVTLFPSTSSLEANS